MMWPFTRTIPKRNLDVPPAISELLDLLQRLKKRDWRCDRVFAAAEHQYELQPCLTDEELSQFERQHKITLPQEYRDFLRYAGNGGAGPDYGLVPLHEAVPWLENRETDGLLSMPFTHIDAITVEQHSDIDENDSFWDDFYSDHLIRGCLRLSHSGCGNYDILVVNGPTSGTVWSDWRGSDVGCLPLNVGFFEWYRDWLEESLDVARLT